MLRGFVQSRISAPNGYKTHSGPDTEVLCWAGGVQAPESLIIWYLPQSSQDIWTQRVTVNLPVLDFGSLFFLLLWESSMLADKSVWVPVMHECSPPGLSGCQNILLLISPENWPGSAAVGRTVHCWPDGNPEQSCCWFWKELGNGVPEAWPKSLPNLSQTTLLLSEQ